MSLSDRTIALPEPTEVGGHFVSNYPPFSCWRPEATTDFTAALEQPPGPGPLNLYVHVPFCQQRCAYCYYRTYPNRQAGRIEPYIDAVLAELDMYLSRPAAADRPLASVYFGGGTPTFLAADQIQRLLAGLHARLPIDRADEFVFECDPITTTRDKLQTLKRLGVTRVSLGMQTLDDRLLENIGRASLSDDCRRAFFTAREVGFEEINVDLLVGLPDQTERMFVETLGTVVGWAPECVTIYQMDLTFNSRLYRGMKIGRPVELPSWPTKRAWVAKGFAALEQQGYTVRNAYMCVRHDPQFRLAYLEENCWQGADLLALGETSFGSLGGFQYQNVDTYSGYTETVTAGRWPLWRAVAMTDELRLRREVAMQLKSGQLEAARFRSKFGVELAQHFAAPIERLVSQGWASYRGDTLRLTRDALIAVDWLLPLFYLPKHVGVRNT